MTFDDAVELLGVDADTPRRAARRAYLRRLRDFPPESDPEGFMRLREAWEIVERVAELREQIPDGPMHRVIFQQEQNEQPPPASDGESQDPESGEPDLFDPDPFEPDLWDQDELAWGGYQTTTLSEEVQTWRAELADRLSDPLLQQMVRNCETADLALVVARLVDSDVPEDSGSDSIDLDAMVRERTAAAKAVLAMMAREYERDMGLRPPQPWVLLNLLLERITERDIAVATALVEAVAQIEAAGVEPDWLRSGAGGQWHVWAGYTRLAPEIEPLLFYYLARDMLDPDGWGGILRLHCLEDRSTVWKAIKPLRASEETAVFAERLEAILKAQRWEERDGGSRFPYGVVAVLIVSVLRGIYSMGGERESNSASHAAYLEHDRSELIRGKMRKYLALCGDSTDVDCVAVRAGLKRASTLGCDAGFRWLCDGDFKAVPSERRAEVTALRQAWRRLCLCPRALPSRARPP